MYYNYNPTSNTRVFSQFYPEISVQYNINVVDVSLTPNNPYSDSSIKYFDINISYGVKNGGNTKFDTNLAKRIRVDRLGDVSGSKINKGGIEYVRENGKWVREQ